MKSTGIVFFCLAFVLCGAPTAPARTDADGTVTRRNGMQQELIVTVEALYARGQEAYGKHDFTGAIALFEEAITLLGDSYYHDNLLDDTDMKLMLADSFKKDGELEKAARIKGNMLSNRITVWKEKYAYERHAKDAGGKE